jgi:hypothetical protein
MSVYVLPDHSTVNWWQSKVQQYAYVTAVGGIVLLVGHIMRL